MCLFSDMQRFSLISEQYLPGELSLPALLPCLATLPALVVQEKEEKEEEAFLAVEIHFVVCRNAKANKRGVRVSVCVCGLTATMLELAFIFHCAYIVYIVQIDICTERNQETFSLST